MVEDEGMTNLNKIAERHVQSYNLFTEKVGFTKLFASDQAMKCQSPPVISMILTCT